MQHSEAVEYVGENAGLPLDFSAGPFVTRCDPVQDVIDSISSLYLDDERDEVVAERWGEEIQDDEEQRLTEGEADALPPPPPVDEEEEESLISVLLATRLTKLEDAIQRIEENLGGLIQGLTEQVRELQNQYSTEYGENRKESEHKYNELLRNLLDI